MRSASTNGSVSSQSTICWCCGVMIENSVFLSGFALRCSVRKRSSKDVEVLRREGDESPLGQLAAENAE